MNTKTNQLRQLLAASEMLTITGCHDALSAHLAEQAGFPAVFMSGFAVSATRLAMPDTGLISFGEMLDQGRNIANAINIPLFGDGDTGFGNAMNAEVFGKPAEPESPPVDLQALQAKIGQLTLENDFLLVPCG